jgi:phage tail-like protein
MADERLFTSFNFRVEIQIRGRKNLLCDAGFAECDGLEITQEPKTIRSGGDNGRVINLVGPASYGQLTLKRGMSASFDLWEWFERALRRDKDALRATCTVLMLASAAAAQQPNVSFVLEGCMPVKLKAPPLSAGSGLIAVEELLIAYEMLTMKRPEA